MCPSVRKRMHKHSCILDSISHASSRSTMSALWKQRCRLTCGNLVTAKFEELGPHDAVMHLNGLIHYSVIPLPEHGAALDISGH